MENGMDSPSSFLFPHILQSPISCSISFSTLVLDSQLVKNPEWCERGEWDGRKEGLSL